jgi:tRNA_anti-like
MLTAVALCLGTTVFAGYPQVAVQAADLHHSYAADARDADLRYKDQSLTVQGVVLGVSAEGDRCAVLLAVAPAPGGRPLPGVSCTAAKGSESEFRKLRPNDKVTLAGTCRGARKDSAAPGGLVVTLTDCRRAR